MCPTTAKCRVKVLASCLVRQYLLSSSCCAVVELMKLSPLQEECPVHLHVREYITSRSNSWGHQVLAPFLGRVSRATTPNRYHHIVSFHFIHNHSHFSSNSSLPSPKSLISTQVSELEDRLWRLATLWTAISMTSSDLLLLPVPFPAILTSTANFFSKSMCGLDSLPFWGASSPKVPTGLIHHSQWSELCTSWTMPHFPQW